MRRARASIAVNAALASASAGNPSMLPRAASELLRLGPSGIYRYLRDWAKRRHPHKGRRWLTKKYWYSTPDSTYFSVVEKTPEGSRRIILIHATSTKIERHIKIRGAANPFDPKDASYFVQRRAEQQRRRAGRATRKAA